MTEEEAREKWCPFVRVQDERGGYAAINRHPYAPKADQMCIASTCMAWRWSDGESEMFAVHIPKADAKATPSLHAPSKEWSYVGPHQANSTYSDNNHYWFKRPWVAGKRAGFCGLAGAPQ